MSERASRKPIADSEISKEQTPGDLPIGIFIDDEGAFSESWERCFKIPGFITMRPNVRGVLTQENEKKAARKIAKFIKGVTDEQLKDTALLVVDQFYDNYDLRRLTIDFVDRLKTLSPNVYILETSGDPRGGLVYGGNDIYWNAGDTMDVIESVPPTPLMRLEAMRYYNRDEALVEARLFDSSFEDPHEFYKRDHRRELSLDKLQSAREFNKIVEKVGVNYLFPIFRKCTPDEQDLLLHNLWTVVGHLRLSGDDEAYGLSLERATQLIQSKLDSQDQEY